MLPIFRLREKSARIFLETKKDSLNEKSIGMKSCLCHRSDRKERAVFNAFRLTPRLPFRLALVAICGYLFIPFTTAQTTLTSDVVERGEDYTVYRRVSAVTEAVGAVTFKTNEFTLLENCLNYFDDGQWKESEDVIETAPGGAVATRGPNKAIFSSDLNSPALFDIQTSDGKRLRGGARAIQLTDVASGKSVTLATVKATALGQLLPPNQIVYPDAFDGLKADVLLVWRHNYFGQDVVIREQPTLPAGMSPDTTRLEIVSEIVEAPQPAIQKQPVQAGKAGQLEDAVVIGFGRLAFVMGKAFPVTNDTAWAVGGLNRSDDSLPVLKQWQTLPDGRMFLVESIAWTDAQAKLKQLPMAAQARATPASKDRMAEARVWPGRPKSLADAKPMQVAQLGYTPNGYVVDFVIIPDSGTPTPLLTGVTYYIKTSYYSGSSVTFQPGCFIKFKNNAYMLLYGPVTFPTSTPKAVFTSRNDNNFGQVIQGVAGETDSNGDPTLHQAAQAIWIYYVSFSTTILNAQIRWAQLGVQYDGGDVTHTLSNSSFEQSQTGVSFNLSAGTLDLNNVTKCIVTTPVTVTG